MNNISSLMPNLIALSLTCSADSSPLTYKVVFVALTAASACNIRVDLPMPGSPPIRTTEPSTKPPPRVLSSSVKPVDKRSLFWDLTSDRF